MTVLLTGATGFVGGHLRSTLAGEALRVRLAVRRAVPELMANEEVAVVGDLGSDCDWTVALDGIETVVHAAARAQGTADGAEDPLSANRRVNTFGTARLAHAAVSAGVRQFIFLSSVKAVGEETPRGTAWDEAVVPAPVETYGVAKLEAEAEVMKAAQASGMGAVVLRPPLVYGPGVKGNFLRLLKLCDSALPLPLGGISNRRSMIYVGNLAAAVVRVIDRDAQGCFFLDDGESLSTSDLVRRLRRLLGRRAPLVPFPAYILSHLGRLLGRGDVTRRLTGSLELDSSAFRRAFDWSPPVSLDAGLAATVGWYRDLSRGAQP